MMETSEDRKQHIDSMVQRFVREHTENLSKRVRDLHEWHCPELSKNQFWVMLEAAATSIMARRGVHRPYEVDEFNKGVILQMWHYVTGSPECHWNVNKGIYLCGPVGCGKTILMEALTEVLHLVSGLNIEVIPAKQLFKRMEECGVESLAGRPLLIDELGREQLEVADFGNKRRPFAELMELRYETGARTFITSNFKVETLSKGYNEKGELIGYGRYIGDRIQETCNIVTMGGSGRREKWEDTL